MLILLGFNCLELSLLVYLEYQIFCSLQYPLFYCLCVGAEETLGNDIILGAILVPVITANYGILNWLGLGWNFHRCTGLRVLLLAGDVWFQCSKTKLNLEYTSCQYYFPYLFCSSISTLPMRIILAKKSDLVSSPSSYSIMISWCGSNLWCQLQMVQIQLFTCDLADLSNYTDWESSQHAQLCWLHATRLSRLIWPAGGRRVKERNEENISDTIPILCRFISGTWRRVDTGSQFLHVNTVYIYPPSQNTVFEISRLISRSWDHDDHTITDLDYLMILRR